MGKAKDESKKREETTTKEKGHLNLGEKRVIYYFLSPPYISFETNPQNLPTTTVKYYSIQKMQASFELYHYYYITCEQLKAL